MKISNFRIAVAIAVVYFIAMVVPFAVTEYWAMIWYPISCPVADWLEGPMDEILGFPNIYYMAVSLINASFLFIVTLCLIAVFRRGKITFSCDRSS
jgi:hypothetical protein